MLPEPKIKALLRDAESRLRVLNGNPNPNNEQATQIVNLQARVASLKEVLGEEHKAMVRDQLRELKITEYEAMKGAVLVLEQILIARGFTNEEELQVNLINVVKFLRGRDGHPTD